MSAARGRANQALYLARIVLDAWREGMTRQDIPAGTLAQAFFPATRQHLLDAYGWFLLAIVQAESLPDTPPRCCAGLPPVPQGKALPGEIRELEQLERDGWLADMLAADAQEPPSRRSRDSLAIAIPAAPGPADAQSWLDHLGSLFERMGDSLDEY